MINMYIKEINEERYVLLSLQLLFFSACMSASSDVRESIKNLERSQFSAKGSDLTLAVCGWQPVSSMTFTRTDADLFPDSTKKRGRGYLYIDGKGKSFECSSKIFFIYTEGYTGGHRSYETFLNFGTFERHNNVTPEVSSRPKSKTLQIGEEISGSISKSSSQIPEGSYADFYSLEIPVRTGIRIDIKRISGDSENSFYPRAFLYQDQNFLSKDDLTGTIVKPGKVHIMVTSGTESGHYKLKISELTEKEKSNIIGW